MVEGPSTTEVTNFDQIYQSLFKEFLEKSTFWDFYEMTREQYINKDEGERKSLFLKYYNMMVQGKFCYLLSVVSDVSLRLSNVSLRLSVVVLLANDSGFEDEFCSVSLIINLPLISSSDKFCSVSEALLANDSLSELIFESGSESESKSLAVKLSFE